MGNDLIAEAIEEIINDPNNPTWQDKLESLQEMELTREELDEFRPELGPFHASLRPSDEDEQKSVHEIARAYSDAAYLLRRRGGSRGNA